MKVLCFGSLNVDYTYKVDHFVRKGETLSSDSLQVFSGGKGLNQSIALAKAGVETYHAGAVGEDGRFLLAQLQEAGVNTDYVAVLEDVRTGNAIIQNDREGDNCILLYGGANQAITPAQADEVLGHFQEGDFLVLQNEINELAYIMEQAHRQGMRIALNPSPMDGKIMGLPLGYVDYFLLNEGEAGQLLGQDAVKPAQGEGGQQPGRRMGKAVDGERLVKALSGKFPNAVILLTLGKEGSVCMGSQGFLRQDSYPVTAVDTTAAGDTFTGFFLGGILQGYPLQEAMDRASKASAIAVTRKGAAPSIPSIQEVERFPG